jgi:GH15 family glucan-1,4-alpha-glucosidase
VDALSNLQPSQLDQLARSLEFVVKQAHWLTGFNNAQPIRFGNAAASQLQLGIYGELADTLHQARACGIELGDAVWKLQLRLIRHLERIWRKPDHGIWETRKQPRRFTQSQAMLWAALDRTIRTAQAEGTQPCSSIGHLKRWRAQVHAEVCEHGFSRERNSFVRHFDS